MFASIFINTCLLFTLSYPVLSSKKYDIEMESARLYGENFNAVLERFRRTPAYLSIVKDKYKDMMTHLHDITVPIMQNLEMTIGEKVAEIVGYTNATLSATVPSILRTRNLRKQNHDEHQEAMNPVQILDGYKLLHQQTSTQERNQFKDLGFQMAEQLADLVIKAMGPVDTPKPSSVAGGGVAHTTQVTMTLSTDFIHNISTPNA